MRAENYICNTLCEVPDMDHAAVKIDNEYLVKLRREIQGVQEA